MQAAALKIAIFFLLSLVKAKPPHEHKLSNAPHIHADGSHDASYDHEAFLGKEEAAKFDKLTKEESARRLELIFDKIDTDRDGSVSYEELRDWIKRVHDHNLERDTTVEFRELGGKDNVLTWEAFTSNAHYNESEVHPDDLAKHREQVERDRMKWARADENRDGVLSEREFLFWQHPTEHPEMREFAIDDTLIRLDKNRDGVVTPEEFVNSRLEPNEKETPALLQQYEGEVRELLRTYDKNKNGVFERSEISDWLAPADYDLIASETHHLISSSDDDKDKKLSKEEIVKHQDLFVGSEATAYGKALQYHEEL